MVTEFERIATRHHARYPLMEPRDYAKLAYQSHFGPEHMLADEQSVLQRIREEWEQVDESAAYHPHEEIGGGLCRFYLNRNAQKDIGAQVLVKLFFLTAKNCALRADSLADKLSVLETLPVPGMKEWLGDYRSKGCPAVSHSDTYRKAYSPHYRLLKKEYAVVFSALVATAQVLKEKGRAVVAIDGRCGCGKSSLGALMKQVFSCNVFHMDDFYLPPNQRTENWLKLPGGNMDLSRFRCEVLDPVFAGKPVDYRPYDCSTGTCAPAVNIPPTPLTVIEGSYSHHPELKAAYDLKLFVTCDKQEQLRRLREREGDYFPTFERLWMPLEEQYIRLCAIENSGAMVVNTGDEIFI